MHIKGATTLLLTIILNHKQSRHHEKNGSHASRPAAGSGEVSVRREGVICCLFRGAGSWAGSVVKGSEKEGERGGAIRK